MQTQIQFQPRPKVQSIRARRCTLWRPLRQRPIATAGCIGRRAATPAQPTADTSAPARNPPLAQCRALQHTWATAQLRALTRTHAGLGASLACVQALRGSLTTVPTQSTRPRPNPSGPLPHMEHAVVADQAHHRRHREQRACAIADMRRRHRRPPCAAQRPGARRALAARERRLPVRRSTARASAGHGRFLWRPAQCLG